ncbi:microsomal glutathione S-transferase 1-like [Macrosteles quadrilineatus]|uniref:microsomal glutathione S-transferase 1-like n=1 Tax=Macrosteles quadrilineatus TaxID=74068 RepID=UPI0023E0A747|nr:microsomal glutathione S-transferase 1-like [Macrosteles quadrilineatus]
MVAPEKLLTLENPVFSAYLFYSCVLALKMLSMSLLTAKARFKKMVFANPEDAAMQPKKGKVKFDDPDVERVRRAHLNDLENIPVFLIVALVYLATDPNPVIAINIFRVFTAARIIHTITYAIVPLPQPSRALAFGVGFIATGYMAFQGLSKLTF